MSFISLRFIPAQFCASLHVKTSPAYL